MSQTTKTGVLFVQLGTPDTPTPAAIRRYLAEFLTDKRVVDLPRALWLPLLHGIILRTRPQHLATLYQNIWRPDGMAPLLYYTQRQAQAVAQQLASEKILVRFAMRYGNPALSTTLHAMVDSGAERILIFPLFPQYSAATTASILDAVQKAMARRRFVPTLRFAQPFFINPEYIKALAEQVHNHTTAATNAEKRHYFLFSFHGLPQRHIHEGDPYADHCQQTAQQLAQALGLRKEQWQYTFQSRFGREVWLEPATDTVLTQLPKRGIKQLTILCPGFVTDCLETLEEIHVQGKKLFLEAGGASFCSIPCLNDTSLWTTALARITRQELSGWLETD